MQASSGIRARAARPAASARRLGTPGAAAVRPASASRRAAVAVAAEISYVMVKPDGVQRGLVGEIIGRFERKGESKMGCGRRASSLRSSSLFCTRGAPLTPPPPPHTQHPPTGFKLVGLKLYQTPESVAKEHYKDLASKPFYPALVEYIVSGPVVAMVLEGDGVVASARKLIGATNPLAAEPGTIRGDLAVEVGRNVVHGSDSPENGERETGERTKEEEDEGRDQGRARRRRRLPFCPRATFPFAHARPPCSPAHQLSKKTTALWFKEGITKWERTNDCWLRE